MMKVLLARLIQNKDITAVAKTIDGIIDEIKDFGGMECTAYKDHKNDCWIILDNTGDVFAVTEKWNCGE